MDSVSAEVWSRHYKTDKGRMSRKVLTMNGAFHPKSDVDGLFVTTEDGGRGLITCGGGGGVRGEENSLGWYVRNSLDVLLQGVRYC